MLHNSQSTYSSACPQLNCITPHNGIILSACGEQRGLSPSFLMGICTSACWLYLHQCKAGKSVEVTSWVEYICKISEGLLPAESLRTEQLKPRAGLPPLLCRLVDRPPEQLQWLGVSYGLTQPLFNFWSRAGFSPVYLRQAPSEITGR